MSCGTSKKIRKNTLADDLSSDEDEISERVPNSLIKEMYAKWREV